MENKESLFLSENLKNIIDYEQLENNFNNQTNFYLQFNNEKIKINKIHYIKFKKSFFKIKLNIKNFNFEIFLKLVNDKSMLKINNLNFHILNKNIKWNLKNSCLTFYANITKQ
jgi:hypothetical protein